MAVAAAASAADKKWGAAGRLGDTLFQEKNIAYVFPYTLAHQTCLPSSNSREVLAYLQSVYLKLQLSDRASVLIFFNTLIFSFDSFSSRS